VGKKRQSDHSARRGKGRDHPDLPRNLNGGTSSIERNYSWKKGEGTHEKISIHYRVRERCRDPEIDRKRKVERRKERGK
jgi:hypothetical protein